MTTKPPKPDERDDLDRNIQKLFEEAASRRGDARDRQNEAHKRVPLRLVVDNTKVKS